MFNDAVVWLRNVSLWMESSGEVSAQMFVSIDTLPHYSDRESDCDLRKGVASKVSCSWPTSGKPVAVRLQSMWTVLLQRVARLIVATDHGQHLTGGIRR